MSKSLKGWLILHNIGRVSEVLFQGPFEIGHFVFLSFWRETYITKSTWPNEYNLILWTWPKNWKRWKLTLEHDWKNITNYDNDQRGQVLMLTFVGVKHFWSCSNQILVILILSSELASVFVRLFYFLNVFVFVLVFLFTFSCLSRWYTFFWLNLFDFLVSCVKVIVCTNALNQFSKSKYHYSYGQIWELDHSQDKA